MEFRFEKVVILESEKNRDSVDKERLLKREEIANKLRELPDEAFTEVQYIQPQINCFNRCSFCSQGAGKTVWQLGLSELEDLISAIKTVAIEVIIRNGKYSRTEIINSDGTFNDNFTMPESGLLGYDRIHRPGVIFPYLDNDISSYKYLDKFVKMLSEDLGVKVRISTTGYSRRNKELQKAHDAINKTLLHTFAGIRFSMTPYTYGYTIQGEKAKVTSRDEFMLDTINLYKTYKPLVEFLGPSKSQACTELRFKPLVNTKVNLSQENYKNHLIIKCGPYLLVSVHQNLKINKSKIVGLDGQWPVINNDGEKFIMIQSDTISNDFNLCQMVVDSVIEHLHKLNGGAVQLEEIKNLLSKYVKSNLYRVVLTNIFLFENKEGPYYSTDPQITEEGYFAKHFYFQTTKRKKAGYIDSERFFLNSLLEYKRKLGLSRKAEFNSASNDDVQEVINLLYRKYKLVVSYDYFAAQYLLKEVIPLIEFYRDVLLGAGYKASCFFNKNFTVDTGTIVNQGRALNEFKGLSSTENLPLTPQEERGYGDFSYSSLRGYVWRWSLTPHLVNKITLGSVGRKNNTNINTSGIEITKLDCRNLLPVKLNNGKYPYKIDEIELERYDIGDKNSIYTIPGEIENSYVKS